jgi:hypothetical protein
MLNEWASLGEIGGITLCLNSRDDEEGAAKFCCVLGCYDYEGIRVEGYLLESFPPKIKCGFYLTRDSLCIVSIRKLRFS